MKMKVKSQESFDYVIGVDVSKAKLDIALPKESLEIANNTKSIQQLVDRIKADSVIVVMEATGGYENQLVQVFHRAQPGHRCTRRVVCVSASARRVRRPEGADTAPRVDTQTSLSLSLPEQAQALQRS